MFPRFQDATRVGIWVVVVAALAGLVVLLLQSRARAAQPIAAAQLAVALAEQAPPSGEERLAAAERLLRDERRRRLRDLTGALLDTGWQLVQGTSPQRAVRGAVRLLGRAARLGDRSRAEDRALALLAAAMDDGATTPELDERYRELLEREHRERLDARIRSAERALEAGELRLARVRAKRWLELDPDSARAAELLDILARRRAPLAEPEVAQPELRPWEPGVALALLVGDYERVSRLAEDDPDAQLARVVALHLAGETDEARAGFSALGGRSDAVGRTARRFHRADEDVEQVFEQARRRHRARRALGWLGGERLSETGFDLSRDGYRAWRESVAITNVAMAAPLRLYRGWHPQDQELVEASRRYLDDRPDGRYAQEAVSWLDALGASRERLDPAWYDGRFSLPRARTPYRGLAAAPLLLTRAAVEGDALRASESLRGVLGDAGALRLVTRRAQVASGALPAGVARELLADLADALEDRALRPHQRTRAELVDGVRRLERALATGLVLVPESWNPPRVGAVEAVETALLTSRGRIPGQMTLERRDDDLGLARSFRRAPFSCPEATLCMDRARSFSGSMYGRVEADGRLKLSARTSFKRASVSLELSGAGPQASIVVPLSHWLRLERWLPLEARVSVSLGGISINPGFDYAAAAD